MKFELQRLLKPPQDYLDGLTLGELKLEEQDALMELAWAQEAFNPGTKRREWYEEQWRDIERTIQLRGGK